MRVMSSLSTEYVGYKVAATVDGAAVDPSTNTARMAFVALGVEPSESNWRDATWLDGGVAAVLVGPLGGENLADGDYDVWLRFTALPEQPTAKVGTLRIT